MFADTIAQTRLSFTRLFQKSVSGSQKPSSSVPKWITNPQMREQLLHDTGLTPEDLGFGPIFEENKPFFMQRNFW
ncbi:MAG: hypothetical protein OEZ19_04375 [Paracoccaceae bacterium]|nr:hypothetical protein [Paracoccaceae bacterium]